MYAVLVGEGLCHTGSGSWTGKVSSYKVFFLSFLATHRRKGSSAGCVFLFSPPSGDFLVIHFLRLESVLTSSLPSSNTFPDHTSWNTTSRLSLSIWRMSVSSHHPWHEAALLRSVLRLSTFHYPALSRSVRPKAPGVREACRNTSWKFALSLCFTFLSVRIPWFFSGPI